MNRSLILLVTAVLCGGVLAAEAGSKDKKMTRSQKNKLSSILIGLKVKASKAKPTRHEVSVPVASAGARGARLRQGNRFAVLWPVDHISPLTALSENLQDDLKKGKSAEEMEKQVAAFQDTYPEFSDEQLMRDLKSAVEKAK
jgi:hypothetical protein